MLSSAKTPAPSDSVDQTGTDHSMLYATLYGGLARGTLSVTQGIDENTAYQGQATALRARAAIQQSVLARSQIMAEQQATEVTTRGRVQATRVVDQAQGYAGGRRAALAAQGINIEAGSALDEQIQVGQNAHLEALTIQNNAALQAYGFKTQSSNMKTESDLAGIQAELSAKQAEARGKQSLLTGGLGAADQLFGSYERYQGLKKGII